MKCIQIFLTVSLALIASIAAAQQEQAPAQTQQPPDYFSNDDRLSEFISTSPEEKDEDADVGGQARRAPEIVPQGWLDDFDYTSDLTAYLNGKFENSVNSGKSTYVYLYADWLEKCKEFRKTAGRKDYVELFETNQIVMLNYNYFEKTQGTRFRNLPVFIKVNKTGVMGPEFIQPVSNKTDHPKKAFYTLKKFFQP